MLTIEKGQPGLYIARSGQQELGSCQYEAQEEKTKITMLSISDPEDAGLLDGLLRTVFFAGLNRGLQKGIICKEAAVGLVPQLEKLGYKIEEIFMVSDLVHSCGCTANKKGE